MSRTLSQKSSRQIAMVFDLNKCIGCQTCAVACKMLWTRDDDRQDGTDYMWWCSVNTMPGRGYPKDWEEMGGGYQDGALKLGVRPTREDFGGWTWRRSLLERRPEGEMLLSTAPTWPAQAVTNSSTHV